MRKGQLFHMLQQRRHEGVHNHDVNETWRLTSEASAAGVTAASEWEEARPDTSLCYQQTEHRQICLHQDYERLALKSMIKLKMP